MIRSVVLRRDDIADPDAYPFSIPAIRALGELPLDPHVTLFAGENGTGKSTLVEAIAVVAGFNPEGGSRHATVSTRRSESVLHRHLRLVRGSRRPRDGYFLRAESFFNVATYLEGLDGGLAPYGGRSLHERSHGESFVTLITTRFGPESLFVLDEPEAALSLRGVLALIRRMHDLAHQGSQFVVSTHSPILLAYPGATIYVLSEEGITRTPYEATDVVRLTRAFLGDPDAFLRHLLDDERR
ncbi:MAG TPA: AAA family ATPase [Candidatus Limnocylindria bacterium]|nr:AAA family ATPase [Candidatus Limnocylindria bacterium]